MALNKICEKYCVNFLRITFMGRTVECCGGNVDSASKCAINKDLYEHHVIQLSKKDLCKAVGMNEEKLMRILCRPEFSNVRRIKQKDNHIYMEVSPKDLDALREWSPRGGKRCAN